MLPVQQLACGKYQLYLRIDPIRRMVVWCNLDLVVDEANHCEHLIEMSSYISNWNSRLNEYCTKLKVG